MVYIPGNERPDEPAKAGVNLMQPHALQNFREAKTCLKQYTQINWREENWNWQHQQTSQKCAAQNYQTHNRTKCTPAPNGTHWLFHLQMWLTKEDFRAHSTSLPWPCQAERGSLAQRGDSLRQAVSNQWRPRHCPVRDLCWNRWLQKKMHIPEPHDTFSTNNLKGSKVRQKHCGVGWYISLIHADLYKPTTGVTASYDEPSAVSGTMYPLCVQSLIS